ncbi:MAG: hypothetical protein PWR01_4047 [Clostridiales bacterium]|nr:hypothetical protein [Clostridiales bacterium]MDN5282974.1 hypothetical protein [Candidatus Ozemobacter sp.]
MIKKSYLSILFFFLFFSPLCLAQNSDSGGVIVIDTRPMLLAHPLFHQYNPETKRFDGTRSEPVPGLESRNFIKADLESNQIAFARFNQAWSAQLAKTSGQQRIKLEKLYLTEKKKYESKIGEIRQRYWATISIPGVPGLTEPASIITQVNQIARDIRDSIQAVRKRTGAGLVIDISTLMPAEPMQYKVDLVQANYLAYLRTGQKKPAEILEWVDEARKYWFNHGNIYNPVIIGAEDKRVEAVKELLSRTGSK